MSFLKFEPSGTSPSGKTKRWKVAAQDGFLLGMIHWYAPWSKYVFEREGAIFDFECLQEITDFSKDETMKHREKS